MSVPQDLPTLGNVEQPRGEPPMPYFCGLDWGASATPSAWSTKPGPCCPLRSRARCRRPGGTAQEARSSGTGRLHSHRHRAPIRPDRRCAGGGRPYGGAHSPKRGQGLPAALPRRRRQERSRRRLHARRHPAHRRPPLPPARALLGRDQGVARPGPRSRRAGGRADRPGQPPA